MPGIDALANTLFGTLTTGTTVTIDNPDLTTPAYALPNNGAGPFSVVPTQLTNAELTTGQVNGNGVFDILMAGVASQLRVEFEAGRISGAEYTKVYLGAIQGAMGAAVQFLLARDQAYWQTLLTQQQALQAQASVVTSLVQLEIAKAQYRTTVFEGMTAEASYALAKAKLATESIAYDTQNYTLTNIMPAQLTLVTEQGNSQRAQTSDTRADTAPVAGLIGTQKALYTQQITSYQRDAEVKAAKLFTDAFNTQVTVDSGTVPPTNFSDASLDTILAKIKTNNGFV